MSADPVAAVGAPVKIRVAGVSYMAASVDRMSRHCQTLAKETDIRRRLRVYHAQRRSRQARPHNGYDEQLSRSEAGLELQAMILDDLAQTEKARKLVAKEIDRPTRRTRNNEQLLHELLVTTFPCGI